MHQFGDIIVITKIVEDLEYCLLAKFIIVMKLNIDAHQKACDIFGQTVTTTMLMDSTTKNTLKGDIFTSSSLRHADSFLWTIVQRTICKGSHNIR